MGGWWQWYKTVYYCYMVTTNVKKMITTCQPMIGHSFHRYHFCNKVKSASSQVAQPAMAYPSFCSIKQLGMLLLPPGWDASPSQGYPPFQEFNRPVIILRCM